MATATLLTQGASGWESAKTDGFVSASITPGANCALVVLIGCVDDSAIGGVHNLLTGSSVTSSGSGPAWTERAVSGTPAAQFEAQSGVFSATIAGSDPGSFTVTWNANQSTDVGARAYAIYKITGHDTGTPFGGKIADPTNSGNGAITVTLDAAPASADITLAISFADEDDAGGGYGAVFDTGWTEDYDGSSLAARCAWNVGQRTGSTSTSVAWTDVNTGPHTYGSSQAAIVVKDGGAGGITGTSAQTLAAFTSTASGISTDPNISIIQAGSGNSATSTTTLAFNCGQNFAIGDVILVCISADNNGASGATSLTSVTDVKGHTYTLVQATYDPGAAAAGQTLGFGYTKVTTAMITTDQITVNFSPATTAKAAVVYKLHPNFSIKKIRMPASGTGGTFGAGSATGTPTITTSSISAGNIFVGALAVESNAAVTADADTSNGAWTTQHTATGSTGTAATSSRIAAQGKVVTGTATQTYNPTLTSADCIIGWIAWAIDPADVTGTSTQTLAPFTSTASGTVSNDVTGTVAATLGAFTSAASGTRTLPAITGTSAQTLAAFTSTASGTFSAGATGTVAVTLAAFTSTASGTRTLPNITGTVAQTLAEFTSAASGTRTLPAVTGTVAVTLAAFTSTASGIRTVPITGTVAVTLAAFTSTASGSFANVLVPVSVSGRKILDQNGNVYLLPTLSSWGMTTQLSDADITSSLEDIAALGFKGVTVWIGGGYEVGTPVTNWNVYTNEAAAALWTGTPWASSLGPGWSSADHVIDECGRLGMVASLSFAGGFSTTGAGDDWEAVTNTNMYNAGVAIATRYLAKSNIVWHIMLDDTHSPASTRGTRIQNLFDGINDTEGAGLRPVRWMEVNNGSSTDDQGWYLNGFFNATINCIYNYTTTNGDSTVAVETGYADTTGPTGDCEPPYVGAPHYPGTESQQLRERNFAVFLEGGCLINFGHEDWWHFDADGLYSDGLTWDQVLASYALVESGYCWSLIDTYCKVATWAPTGSFVTTGEGTSGTKAAIGASNTAAIAYFPSSRTVVVDTTILAGTTNVRLRWYDPTAGTFSTIATSEAQNSSRSVTYNGGTHGDGAADWVLVVDLTQDVTGTVAQTLAAFTSSASGIRTLPAITGTSAQTLAAFTSAASGTRTVPSFTGTVAATLAAFTSTASGTHTPPSITGTVAVTLAAFTSTASGTRTLPNITGTVAVTLAAFVSSASGTRTIPNITGTSAQTLAAFTSTASGTVAGPGAIVGTVAVTLAAFTSSASGTRTIPNITGTSAQTLAAFTSTASGTSTSPGFTGTVAVTLAAFTSTASGTVSAPSGSGTAAITLADFTSTATGTRALPSITGTVDVTLAAFIGLAFQGVLVITGRLTTSSSEQARSTGAAPSVHATTTVGNTRDTKDSRT